MKNDVMRFLIVALAIVGVSCSPKSGPGSGGTSAASTTAMPDAAGSGVAITPPTVAYGATTEAEGPGLRRQAIESLALPVPRTIDLAYVQPENFAAGLGKDPTRIFEYLRDQIAYEPYVGLLRGPRGTLLAMAGNAADRAALLGELLRRSGFQVRYAHGTLPEPLAQRLVNSVWAERRWVEAAASASGTPSPEIKSLGDRLIGSIRSDKEMLHHMLQNARLPKQPAPAVTMQILLTEARDHYWIEWLQDGKWTAMDPSFATATPGQTFAKATESFETLPESIYHHVDIKVRVEEYTGKQPSSREVLHYKARSADLSGEDLVLVHSPVDRRNQGNAQVRPAFIAQQKRYDGEPFWVSEGRLPAGGGLADALGGGDGTVEVPLAAAEFIEMDLIAPGGQKATEIRELFDHVGKARRVASKVLDPAELAEAASLNADKLASTVYSIFFTTGAIDLVHARGLVAPKPTTDSGHLDVGTCLRRINIGFAVTSDSLTSRTEKANGIVSRNYFDSPRVQIAQLTATADMLTVELDLRRDVARTLVTGLRPDLAFNVRVWRGVVDGTLERYLIEYLLRSANDRSRISTSTLFESARARNTPAVLFAQNGMMPGSALTANTRARIEESMAAGNVLVAPVQPAVIGGAQRYAWWQIDPHSGETIAVTDDGGHTLAETITVTAPAGVTGMVAVEVTMPGAGTVYTVLSSSAAIPAFVQGISSYFGMAVMLIII